MYFPINNLYREEDLRIAPHWKILCYFKQKAYETDKASESLEHAN